MITLRKTAPAWEGRTGRLIREALLAAGVQHRVGAGSAFGYLLVTGQPEGRAVAVIAHDCHGNAGYDVERASFIGYNAVVTEGIGRDSMTSLVYHGTREGRGLMPAEEAIECARAVAAYLGLPTA